MGAQDEPSIADAERLHRRVLNTPDCLVYDDNLGRFRPTSVGFKIDPDGISVYRQSVLVADGLGPEAVAAAGRSGLVYSFTAGDARTESFGVVADPVVPTVQPVDPAHALVKPDLRWTKGHAKKHLTALIRQASLTVGETPES